MNKKSIYLLAIGALSLGIFQACSKEEENKVINRAIDVNLNINETYNLTMMEDVYGDELKIVKQATHFAASSVAELPKQQPKNEETLESSAYTYTPTLNYVGDDEVTMTGEGEHVRMRKCGNEPKDNHKDGKHDKEEDDDEEVTVNTTIRFHIVNNPLKN